MCVVRTIRAMRLQDWLAEHDISYSEFGRRIGRAHTTVSRIARDEQRPDWPTMEAITRETNGAVRPNDFCEPEVA